MSWVLVEPGEGSMGLGEEGAWKGVVVSDVELPLACRLVHSEPGLYTAEPSEFILPPMGRVEVSVKRGKAEVGRVDRMFIHHMVFQGPPGTSPSAAIAAGLAAPRPMPLLEVQLPIVSHSDHPKFPASFAPPLTTSRPNRPPISAYNSERI